MKPFFTLFTAFGCERFLSFLFGLASEQFATTFAVRRTVYQNTVKKVGRAINKHDAIQKMFL